MGNVRATAANCLKANACLCKIISIVLILISFSLIIAGSVMAAKKSKCKFGFDDFEEYDECVRNQNFGMALIATGVFLLICSIVTCCCAFQLGLCKRCLQRPNESEEPIFEEQLQPNGTHRVLLPSTAPAQSDAPQAPERPPGPMPPRVPERPSVPPPSEAILLPCPPQMPPAYEDIAGMAKAPPPYPTSPNKTLN